MFRCVRIAGGSTGGARALGCVPGYYVAGTVCGCDAGGAGATVVDFTGAGRGGAEATAHSRGDVPRGLWGGEAMAAGRRTRGGAANRRLGAGE